jgi:S1-C subfamily serine protease
MSVVVKHALHAILLISGITTLTAQEPVPPAGPDSAAVIRLERSPPPGALPRMARVQVLATRRARLGVSVNMRARETDSIGALVQGVTPNGPAARAGIRSGDIITRFNGTPLVGRGVDAGEEQSGPGVALTVLAAGLNPGDTVALEYRRGRVRKNAVVIAGDEPFLTWSGPQGSFGYIFGDSGEEPARSGRWRVELDSVRIQLDTLIRRHRPRRPPPPVFFMMGTPLEDLELAPLNRDLGRYFGTSEGVLVIRTPEDSRLGLRAGDVVQAVDGRVPTSPAQLLRILRSYEAGETFQLDIVRMKKREKVTGTLGER